MSAWNPTTDSGRLGARPLEILGDEAARAVGEQPVRLEFADGVDDRFHPSVSKSVTTVGS